MNSKEHNNSRKFYQQLADGVIHKVPFNKVLGMKVEQISSERCEVSFVSKPELIGNYYQEILHGGIISAVLDSVGGLMAAVSLFEKAYKMSDSDMNTLKQKMTRLGTIDLRVDYLLPARGEKFVASARLIRKGTKIAVIRSEFHNMENEIVALGTASYLVG